MDDEPKIRKGIERLISNNGDKWKITGSFYSGEQCVNTMKEANLSFEVVFTDVRMPVRNGLEMLKKLNTEVNHSFFAVVISGYNDFSYIQTAMREGAVDYLTKPIDRLELKARLQKIKNEVMKQREQARGAKQEKEMGPIQTTRRWIDQHLHEAITIEKVSSLVYMNPTYFTEYFKRHTGETVLDYVTRKRMEKARALLLASPMKIYEIASAVGYSDTKYFSKLFKKHYGELPSKYKQEYL